jgi:hypothetical protein
VKKGKFSSTWKRSWSKLVSTRRWTVLILPFSKASLVQPYGAGCKLRAQHVHVLYVWCLRYLPWSAIGKLSYRIKSEHKTARTGFTVVDCRQTDRKKGTGNEEILERSVCVMRQQTCWCFQTQQPNTTDCERAGLTSDTELIESDPWTKRSNDGWQRQSRPIGRSTQTDFARALGWGSHFSTKKTN